MKTAVEIPSWAYICLWIGLGYSMVMNVFTTDICSLQMVIYTFDYIVTWLKFIVKYNFIQIIFNKLILSTWDFNFPFLLTSWHGIFSAVLTRILIRFKPEMFPSVGEKKMTTRIYVLKLVPVACCQAGGLVLGNMAYRYISLSYIQMLKAFTPIPLLLVNFVLGRDQPSTLLFAIVLMVCLGVVLASVGEMLFDITGFLLMVSFNNIIIRYIW